MNVGYQTSKNRVSMGLSLTDERAFKLRRLAADNGIKIAEQVGRLVDAAWMQVKSDNESHSKKSADEIEVAA